MTHLAAPITRRTLLGTGLAAAAAASAPFSLHSQESTMTTQDSAWPNEARLAVSFSLMFEAGGQPISGAGGVIPDPIRDDLPDLPTNAFFQYGVYEGVPRILDLMDKHGVKLSSFMIGRAVEKADDLANEIVRRGHEAAAHGRTWENSYFLDGDAERRFIADSVESIAKATGQTPKGWNAYWMRNSVRTLDILQSLGFTYHIDEPSRDEPFIVPLKGGDFVTVPYTFHINDIVSFPFVGWNAAAYEQALRDEFDQLYEEGATRRRMMVVSLHDRISGHANRVRVLDRFLAYAKSKPGVWFARKDEIAAWALQHRGRTPGLDRGPAGQSELPGSAA
ncbi:polysaccharide deacetylase family protein [Lichenifustis flavocetrariae]|uniref:Chitooligosaccharide deacetylase n=1 Tax=Lichenifustis flavocetrariae TaxID=2949735 RepID=A0AA41YXT9_9HYPH|nr:polysaccharide deacetylase family protein [Lichenifustis flavocetrariae]MCW6509236.1 polysaccharide deacetylase family protein [Lichenifustis flavocetrariae]